MASCGSSGEIPAVVKGTNAVRGYFGIGVEGVSKAANAGAVMRTAHAFGAAFTFAVAPVADLTGMREADTSAAAGSVPHYTVDTLAELGLPQGCRLVGIELMDRSVELPSFRHPARAAYLLGSERGGLSPDVAAACDFVVRIPIRFSINLSLAGALVMYDRMLTLGRFPPRPVQPGGPTEPLAPHRHGLPKSLR